jgi:hypothetical protein
VSSLCLSIIGCSAQLAKNEDFPPAPVLVKVSPTNLPRGAEKIFVDSQIRAESCRDYDPKSRSCGGGDQLAYRRLNQASVAAAPGSEVLVRQAVIRKQFKPASSGAEGLPIHFHPYGSEKVVFTDIDAPALFLLDRDYLIIEGFHVKDSLGWGRLENAHYNLLRNNQFNRALARGTTGGLKITYSHYNQIEGNRFEHANDSLVIQASDRNLIQDNAFEWARHSLLSLRCGNYNVIRGNSFHNERQKAMEVYDCEAISDAPYRLDATKRNLIERNHFTYTRGSSQAHRYNAIQFSGQYSIARQNIFMHNRGGGINISVYADEALHNYGHRIYANTFYANRCYAFNSSSRGGKRVGGYMMLNNLFYKNVDCRGRGRQLDNPWGDLDEGLNAIVEEDPKFVFAEPGDLRLRGDSPWVDKGHFLTQVRSSGQGRKLPVEDATFFFDGAGVPGVMGDQIQLQFGEQIARVVEIDISSHTLVLDKALSWSEGEGVSLPFHGDSPDMGAFESDPKQ